MFPAPARRSRSKVWARRYRYALKMDVQRYFPSTDHALLEAKLERRIKDRRVLALLGRIIATSPLQGGTVTYFSGDDLLTPLSRRTGIPIGNLTSQFFTAAEAGRILKMIEYQIIIVLMPALEMTLWIDSGRPGG